MKYILQIFFLNPIPFIMMGHLDILFIFSFSCQPTDCCSVIISHTTNNVFPFIFSKKHFVFYWGYEFYIRLEKNILHTSYTHKS